MEEKISYGITIDQCKSCKGLWFDKDELLAFCIMSGHDRNLVEKALNRFEHISVTEENFCPRCKSCKLNKTRIASVQILNCDNCKGFYISNEEIQHLLIHLHTKKESVKLQKTGNVFSGGLLGFGLEEIISEIFDI